jgi:hypothetical protein
MWVVGWFDIVSADCRWSLHKACRMYVQYLHSTYCGTAYVRWHMRWLQYDLADVEHRKLDKARVWCCRVQLHRKGWLTSVRRCTRQVVWLSYWVGYMKDICFILFYVPSVKRNIAMRTNKLAWKEHQLWRKAGGVSIREQKIRFMFIFKCSFCVEIPKYVTFSDSYATFIQAMQEGRLRTHCLPIVR